MVFSNAKRAIRNMLFFGFAGMFVASAIADGIVEKEDQSFAEEVVISIGNSLKDLVDVIVPDSLLPPRINIPTYTWEYKSFDREVKCLADNIYFEAGHEEYRGQVAVGLVTLNRVKSGEYPSSICGVVWQVGVNKKTGRKAAQFSWTRDGKPDVPRNREVWERCYQLAKDMLDGQSLENYDDFTNGATHYHATYVSPRWRHRMEKVEKIGLHIFYRDPNNLGSGA